MINLKATVCSIFLLILSTHGYGQNYSLGESLNPSKSDFELIGISSKTGVSAYRYKRHVSARFYGRQLGDIIVGVKDGHIAQTIYLMIPENSDRGVPKEILNLIQAVLPFPLSYVNGRYVVNIDNYSISLSRTNNAITFNKDRIMYMSSIKQSILER
ncbi:hypothetical protein U8695_06905 [Aquirufa antheringensis]|jgi:hypothetical protein